MIYNKSTRLCNAVYVLLLVGVAFSAKALPAQAQVGTSHFQWGSTEQLSRLARMNSKNPRASYDIIVSATKRGMVNSVIRTYQELLKQQPQNSFLQAAYAFSVHLPLWERRWDWAEDKTLAAPKLWAQQGQTNLYRQSSLKAMSSSPEVLLMAAIGLTSQENRQEAVRLVNRAVQLAPKWADAYYWQAYILDNYATSQPKLQRKQYAYSILTALNTAERLDPSLRSEALIRKSYAYLYLDRPRDALTMFDAYNRVKPGYRVYLNRLSPDLFENNRTQIANMIQK